MIKILAFLIGFSAFAGVAPNINSLVPSQTGQSGKFLSTDGTSTSWGSGAGSGVASINSITGATTIAGSSGVSVSSASSTITAQLASIASNSFLFNTSTGSLAPVGTSLTTALDTSSTAQGTIIQRGASTWAASAALNLGSSGTGGSQGSATFNGGTSGAVTIQPNNATLTYNFNLPGGAGNVGQLLTSNGGGNQAMQWTTVTGSGGVSVASTSTTLVASLSSIASNNLLFNTSTGSLAPVATTMSVALDDAIGATSGATLYRGASTWSTLSPGTSAQVYTISTSGYPYWATSGGGGSSGSSGNVNKSDGSGGFVSSNFSISGGNGNLFNRLNFGTVGNYIDGTGGNGNANRMHFRTNGSTFEFSAVGNSPTIQFLDAGSSSGEPGTIIGSPLTLESGGGAGLTLTGDGGSGILIKTSGTSHSPHVEYTNGANGTPAVSACGTSPSIVGNDSVGRITVGTGGIATSCTITFVQSWTNTPICVISDESTSLLLRPAPSTTALVLNAATPFGASDTIGYHCVGYQ